jgi:hypothetical protein
MEASHGKGGFTYKKARCSTCMARELNKESMLPYSKESKLITCRFCLFADGSKGSLIEKNSTERKLEPIYLNISLFRYFFDSKFGVP